eukprot:scaffold17685_cov63-Phaeocystis_antarctica.AAC.7
MPAAAASPTPEVLPAERLLRGNKTTERCTVRRPRQSPSAMLPSTSSSASSLMSTACPADTAPTSAKNVRTEAKSMAARATHPSALERPSEGSTAVGSHALVTAAATIQALASDEPSICHASTRPVVTSTSPATRSGSSTRGGQTFGGRCHHGRRFRSTPAVSIISRAERGASSSGRPPLASSTLSRLKKMRRLKTT